MGNDSNSHMYGKIHRAVNACPALRTIRRMSPGSRRTSPATDSSPPHSGEATGTIPIVFDYSNHSAANEKPKPATQQNGQVPGKVTKTGPRTVSPPLERSEGHSKSGMQIEDRFTDYIKRAKVKIRTTSNVGDRKEPSVKDKSTKSSVGDKMELSANDQFTDYIRRTGAKIRIASSIGGGGKSHSSK